MYFSRSIILLIFIIGFTTLAQEATEPPEPPPTLTETPLPTLTPTFTETATLLPSETATLPVVETPTVETTAEVTVEPAPETTAEITTEATTAPLILEPEPEPPLTAVVSDAFVSDSTNGWSLGAGWNLVPNEMNYALQTVQTTDSVTYTGEPLSNVVVEMLVQTSTGFELTVRQNAAGQNQLRLFPNGQISLYRNRLLLAETHITPTPVQQWRHIRLSAMGYTFRVAVDGVEVLVATDPQNLLMIGTVSFRPLAVSENPTQVDNIRFWVPDWTVIHSDPALLSESFAALSVDDPLITFDPDGSPYNKSGSNASVLPIGNPGNALVGYLDLLHPAFSVRYNPQGTIYVQDVVFEVYTSQTNPILTVSVGWSSNPNGIGYQYFYPIPAVGWQTISLSDFIPVIPGDVSVVGIAVYLNGYSSQTFNDIRLDNIQIISGNPIAPTQTNTPTPTNTPTETATPTATESMCTGIVNAGGSGLNLRSAPNIGANLVGIVPDQSAISLVGRTEDNLWLHVFYNDEYVWAYAEYVTYSCQLPIVNEIGQTATPTTTPTPSPTQNPLTPTPTPIPRDVAPEAQAFHDHAAEFGLPLPFDTLPVLQSSVRQIQGYGANTFTWTRSDYTKSSTYRETHGYHTGLDYSAGNGSSIQVIAVCDGVILSGRLLTGNGGTTKANTGRGFVLRCFQDDPTLVDPDGDGHRNLSNIAVAYNHVIDLNGSFPTPGDIVREGEILAQTTGYFECSATQCNRTIYGTQCEALQPGGNCDSWLQPNHLHLEVFIARGFRDGTRNQPNDGDGGDAIRINPMLMFVEDFDAFHGDDSILQPYYPIRVDYHFLGDRMLIESPPTDFVDNAIMGDDERIDTDYGLNESDLTLFLPAGEVVRSEWDGSSTSIRSLFWTRANSNENITGVQQIFSQGAEWTNYSLITSTDLINYLFSNEPTIYQQNQLYVGTAPHCTNVFLEPLTDLPAEPCGGDGSVAQDDADLNIPPVGIGG